MHTYSGMAAMSVDLNALYRAANKAVTLACQQRMVDDALSQATVNWARIGCYQAERFEAHDGETGVRVYIEDAAPEDRVLKEFIQDQLARDGFGRVEVVTEW